jgi:hypothetical protein
VLKGLFFIGSGLETEAGSTKSLDVIAVIVLRRRDEFVSPAEK